MNLTKEFAELIVHATSGRKDRIIKCIREQGFTVSDETETGSMYYNLKVMNDDGTVIRIYKSFRGKAEVQKWEPVVFRYSGIPVCDPGYYLGKCK